MANEETIESQIEVAMASRIPHFRQQADTLTFEGVRRLLEKDLGLDKFALDVHKRFVKQLLSKVLVSVADPSPAIVNIIHPFSLWGTILSLSCNMKGSSFVLFMIITHMSKLCNIIIFASSYIENTY
uniref:Uncharacterized protein n=1 Tax=Daucus carota subsp. sativus TaxID=79200 RepID=A0A166BTQ0_DAUCS